VLYEMVAGKPPFEAQTPEAYLGQHLHATPPPLDTRRLPATVGPRLAAIIRRALEKDRTRRFRNAEEFRRALEELEPEAQKTLAIPEPTSRPARRPFSFAAAAGLIVLAGAIAVYAVIHGTRAPQSAAPPVLPTAAPEPTPIAPPTPFDSVVAAASPPAAPQRARSSSRNVADPSEAGRSEAPHPAAPPRPTAEAASPSESAEEASEPAVKMDERGAKRFRDFLAAWRGLPPERQSFEARPLARSANRFVKVFPDDPLTAELRQKLPGDLRDLALRELDRGRPRVAARFYAAYRELDFAAADPALDRRFADLPANEH
jgi:hypothetical protein